jgi:hypothetical protein
VAFLAEVQESCQTAADCLRGDFWESGLEGLGVDYALDR